MFTVLIRRYDVRRPGSYHRAPSIRRTKANMNITKLKRKKRKESWAETAMVGHSVLKTCPLFDKHMIRPFEWVRVTRNTQNWIYTIQSQISDKSIHLTDDPAGHRTQQKSKHLFIVFSHWMAIIIHFYFFLCINNFHAMCVMNTYTEHRRHPHRPPWTRNYWLTIVREKHTSSNRELETDELRSIIIMAVAVMCEP